MSEISDDAFEKMLKSMYGDMELPPELKAQIRQAMNDETVDKENNPIPLEDQEPINTNDLSADLNNVLELVRSRSGNFGCGCG